MSNVIKLIVLILMLVSGVSAQDGVPPFPEDIPYETPAPDIQEWDIRAECFYANPDGSGEGAVYFGYSLRGSEPLGLQNAGLVCENYCLVTQGFFPYGFEPGVVSHAFGVFTSGSVTWSVKLFGEERSVTGSPALPACADLYENPDYGQFQDDGYQILMNTIIFCGLEPGSRWSWTVNGWPITDGGGLIVTEANSDGCVTMVTFPSEPAEPDAYAVFPA